MLKFTLSQNIFRACKRLNYKYVNRLKRTGKLLKAQSYLGRVVQSWAKITQGKCEI